MDTMNAAAAKIAELAAAYCAVAARLDAQTDATFPAWVAERDAALAALRKAISRAVASRPGKHPGYRVAEFGGRHFGLALTVTRTHSSSDRSWSVVERDAAGQYVGSIATVANLDRAHAAIARTVLGDVVPARC